MVFGEFRVFAVVMPKAKSKIQVSNKRATFDYELLETYTGTPAIAGSFARWGKGLHRQETPA